MGTENSDACVQDSEGILTSDQRGCEPQGTLVSMLCDLHSV